jgi:hypothetical protein
VHLGTDDSAILLTAHHIVFDGWSLDLAKRDLTALYTAILDGRPPVLPAVEVRYVDFCVWQRQTLRGEYLEGLRRYWLGVLAGNLVPLRLPANVSRPASRTFIYGRYRTSLGSDLCDQLRAFGRDAQATLFMIVAAALQTMLHFESGQDDVRIATMTAGRTRPEVEHVIGLFMNTLILRTDLSGDPTVRELLSRARAVVLGAMEHEDLPFAMVRQALMEERGVPLENVAQVLLVFEHTLAGLTAAEGLIPTPLPDVPEGREALFSSYELIFEVADGPPASVLLKYDADMYKADTAERLVRGLIEILGWFAANPDGRLSQLSQPMS